MADKKISQLTALSAANLAPSTDVLAIVDTSATETKKIVAQDLINGVLNVASAVGIGTASPGQKLDVQGSATDFVAFNGLNTNNNAGTITSSAIKFGFTSTVGTHYATLKITEDSVNSNSGGLTISLPNGGVETPLLALTSAGNLGIGTTSPNNKLQSSYSAPVSVPAAGAGGHGVAVGSAGYGLVGGALSSGNAYLQATRWDGSAINYDMVLQPNGGNLGLGVTPSAWGGGLNGTGFQVGAYTSITSANAFGAGYGFNFYYDGTNYRYVSSNYASLIEQSGGAFRFKTAASGTAGNAISFTQAMTLDANGVLLRGNTTARSTNALGAGQMQVEAANFSAFQMFANANSTDGSYMGLWKSRGGALGGTTIVQNGDLCGAIYFGGYDGTTAQPAAYIAAFVDGTPGASDMPGRLTFSTTADGSINPVERGRFTAGGFFKASNSGTYAGSTGTYHELYSNVSNAEAVIITNAAASNPYGPTITFSAAAPNDATRWFLNCGDNVATRAVIRSNGGLANYQSNNVDLSDARTKKDIAPAASMWDKIGALEIVTYKYNDQTHDDVNVGVIAQQVESVEPVWVDADGFGETPEGEEPLKTVYTKDITFAAIKALQEAMARIESLEAKVAALEAQ